jgi:LmbE family N-acetylglucosaminyl deacetylase
MKVPELGTILGVYAHPDDETYLAAGLMARAAREGKRVVCVTATRGELGSWDEERWPTETMGKVREGELLASLEVIGVKEHSFLDYDDAACKDVPHAEGVARVRKFIEDVQPDTVLTFGPDGMTDHADHKAVSAWTTDAFAEAGKPGAKLYYATTTPEWKEKYYDRLQEFNVFEGPGTPPVTPLEALDIYFPIPADLMALKFEGIRKHVSQIEGMLNTFGDELFRAIIELEAYRLAAAK